MVAGGTADNVEHFQNRHAAADELRKGPGEPRHANFMHKWSEDRQLEFPAIAQLATPGGAQEGADTEDRATDSENHEIPVRSKKITQVDQELRRRR
jgi:hypothetical protein